MNNLSPAAQQVFWAFNRAASGKPDDWHYLPAIAAALRAAADHCDSGELALTCLHSIHAIADELEAQTEPQISEEENERRFREALRIIQNTTSEELTELMGEEFLEEFRRVSRR